MLVQGSHNAYGLSCRCVTITKCMYIHECWHPCARVAKAMILGMKCVVMAGGPCASPGKAAEAGRYARAGARGSWRGTEALDSQQPEEQEQPGLLASPATAHCSTANRSFTSSALLHVYCWQKVLPADTATVAACHWPGHLVYLLPCPTLRTCKSAS